MSTTTLKRLLALLFASTLALAACGGGDTDADADGDDGDTTEEGSDSGDSGDDGDDGDVELTQGGGTLASVISAGTLKCGVSGAAVAFSEADSEGVQQGFDADYCRAVAAAVLGDAEAVEFVPLTAAERFSAVQSGDVDVLMRNSTWTQSRDTEVGMDFGPTTYYDGQQVMGKASAGFTADSTLEDMDGAVVCTNAGTTTETNISEAADVLGIQITLNTAEDFDIVTENFIAGSCDLITTDGSGLVGRKAKQQPEGEEWVIFPSAPISKEPLGPVYAQNDSEWADVVNWTVYATILADEQDVTSANVDDALANGTPEMQRLLGFEGEDVDGEKQGGELQTKMGLEADAFYNVISQVGNYDEMFTRSLGPVGIKRDGSPNAAWNEGGLIYAPPAR